MTTAQDPIAHAARLLREAAEELRQALEDWEQAIGAGGVQALSAAPAIGDDLRDTLVAVSAAIAEQDDRAAQKMICEILAASPTPPAEQQAAPKAAPVRACVCGEPQASGTVHRVDGPCYVAAPQQEAQEPYPIDTDPQGIRAIVADAITGALAFGAQGANPPPEGHWLTPFWEMAREEAMRTKPALLSRDTLYLLRRLLSNQHTLTGPEFRAELEKVVGEAYQQEAQEPAAFIHWPINGPPRLVWYSQKALNDAILKTHEDGYKPDVKLYTAPQPAPAPVSDDTERLREALQRIEGASTSMYATRSDMLEHCQDIARAALAAQGGK